MNRIITIALAAIVLCAATMFPGASAAAGGEEARPATPIFPNSLVRVEKTHPKTVFAGRPGAWDAYLRERSWVMRDGDQWHLWYTGYNSPKLVARHRLGYATSSDGINWRRSGDPLLEDTWVEDPMVLRVQGTYFMFSEGEEDRAQLMTSKDGIDWQWLGYLDIRKSNGQPISPGPFGTPTAWYEDGQWWLFYERNDAGVWLARSRDLKHWVNVDDAPVIRPGPDGYDDSLIAMDQVFRYKNLYYALLHGRSRAADSHWISYIAVSDDLRHWYKYWGNPIINYHEDMGSPVIVEDDGRMRIYTTGADVRLHYMVGE